MNQIGYFAWLFVLSTSAIAYVQPELRAQTPRPIESAPPPNASRLRRLPPVERPIATVGYVEVAESSRRATHALSLVPEEIVANGIQQPSGFPIDLATALRLAEGSNLQVALARAQVAQALARVDAADALWLPSIRGGVSYDRHEGAIQAVAGEQFNTSRGAFYSGLGSGGFGAGQIPVPGVYANFHLADAWFGPLAARQFAAARNHAASAATNDTLLQITIAYFELLRAGQDVAISQATLTDAQQLTNVTTAYAETGAGLPADANRSRADLAIRTNDLTRAREGQRVAQVRLAQLLRLDPTVALDPIDPIVAPIEVISLDTPVTDLVSQGLSQRPELAEAQALVCEAVQRMRRERAAPLVPSFLLSASYGGMGAGINADMAGVSDRLDVDAIAFWELRNFGFGDAAARRAAQSTLRVTQVRQMAMLDQVAREVVEAHAQVQSRKMQMATAKLGIEAALASQRQNVERIEQGKGLPIEVLQSVAALAQARREYLRTVIDYNAAQFTLFRAIGWPTKMPLETVSANGF